MDPIKDSQGSIESDVTPPDRSSSSSAPPALQLASESLFAWKVEYAKIFSDIRAHEDYFNFYEHFKEEKRGLPPPLDPTGFLFEFDEDLNKQKTMYVQPGSSYDSNDIQQSMQNMKLNSKPPYGGVDIPAPNTGTPGVWNPVPRPGRKNMGFTESFEETNLLLNRMAEKFDLAYSSSPSAQTAVGAVNYIWKDEEPSNNSSVTNNSNSTNGTSTFGFFNSGTTATNSAASSATTTPIKKDNKTSEIIETSGMTEATSPTRSNVVCRYYASGYCSRGDKCFYSHDLTQKHAILSPIEEDREDLPLPQQKLDNSTSPVTVGALNNNAPSNSSSSASTSNVANTITTPTKNEPKNASSKKNNVSANSSSNSIGKGSNSNGSGNNAKNNNNNNNNSRGGTSSSSNNSSSISTPTPKSTSPTPMSMNNANAAALEAPVSPRSQEYNFDTLIGRIYHVCKDQQGCRFLQKKLEENEPKVTEIIFNEVYDHISELMIDPFGNYLCQKILEHCNDHQRFLVVQKVASELVQISKNMHGTRAVQKMIECLSSPSQIELVKRALCNSVVELIQDLNGNHVIQRCLNRLSPEDNQFIYDAVTSGNNCVEVATHRHGCCVLQRCIDHASTKQKIQLIHEITKNALVLVQDAYGNYVVQYILDLPFPNLVDSLAKSFVGNIRILATQKFSSNVVEKCLQSCSPDVRYVLVKEILGEKHHFLQLLQDPFANYVIQTALTTCEPQQHHDLIEAIKPFMTQLRNTPYGKRIQSKITKESHHSSESKHHKHR